MKTKWTIREIERLASKAQDAFWKVVATEIPNVPSDVDPGALMNFDAQCCNAIKHWIKNNAAHGRSRDPLTFSDFHKSAKLVRLDDENLGAFNAHGYLLYDNGACYIEIRDDAQGYYLILDRDEYTSSSLQELERILYTEWYLPEVCNVPFRS